MQEPDYRAKYNGIQAAYQKRQNEVAAQEAGWQAERSAYEAKIAKLAEYEAREAQANEAATAQAEYEALRARFEPEPPTPWQHSELRQTTGPREPSLAELRAKLDRQVGKPSPTGDWPDVTAE